MTDDNPVSGSLELIEHVLKILNDEDDITYYLW